MSIPDAPDFGHLVRSIFGHADWQALDHGTLEEDQANARFAERTGLALEDVQRLVLASKASLTPIEETVELLEEVHGKGLQLFCLSNMGRGTFSFIRERHGFWDRFQGIVVSSLVGVAKPDPAIFRRLLETYRLEAEQTVLLDDSLPNVEAARSVGLHAIHFQGAKKARAALRELGAL